MHIHEFLDSPNQIIGSLRRQPTIYKINMILIVVRKRIKTHIKIHVLNFLYKLEMQVDKLCNIKKDTTENTVNTLQRWDTQVAYTCCLSLKIVFLLNLQWVVHSILI